MRRETPEHQHDGSAYHGAGTRVDVHRSRHELERVLSSFGASEVLFVEADANASLQFELNGRCVQMAMPLPDPAHARFTHTPTGKPRATAAQERAYEQALREHWRSLVVAVRGKLQSVESGISTFEHEFERFFVPRFAEERRSRRERKAPKAVSWLLGGSHSLAIALVAAFLVPASAVGAFALPTNVVGHLAAPFHSEVRDGAPAGGDADSGLVLARGGWRPASGDASSLENGSRLFARSSEDLAGDSAGELRRTANLSSPPVESLDTPSTTAPVLASARTTPLPTAASGPSAPPPSAPSAGVQAPPPSSNADEPESAPASSDETLSEPADSGEAPAPSDEGDDVSMPTAPDNAESAASDVQPASEEPGGVSAPAANEDAPGVATPPDNGNANGNGNGIGNGGTPPGQEKKDDPSNTPPGQAKKDDPPTSDAPAQPANPGNGNADGNGNGNGNGGTPPGQAKKGSAKGGK